MYVRAFAKKAVVQVSWLGSVREGRLSAAGDKRPIEPCRHAASRVHASAETATYMVSRRTDRLAKPVRRVRARLRGVRVPS